MPRQKGAARRLDADDRASQQWNMQDQTGPSQNILTINLDDGTDSEDGEYAPSGSEDDVQYIAQTDTVTSRNVHKARKPIKKASKPRKTSKSKAKGGGGDRLDDRLQSLIDSATFYVNIRVIMDKENNGEIGEPSKSNKGRKQLSSKEILATLGQFQFSLLQNDSNFLGSDYNAFHVSVLTSNEFWLYISPIENRSFFYFEKEKVGSSKKIAERKFYPITNIPDGVKHLQAFEQGTLGLKKSGLCLTLDSTVLNPATESDQTIVVDVSLIESNLPKLNHPSDYVSKVSPLLKDAQEHFINSMARKNVKDETEVIDPQPKKFDIVHDESDLLTRARPDVDHLYETIKEYHDKRKYIELRNPKIDTNPQHKSLLPTLRPYQVNAVRWMVFRELQAELEASSNELHALYREVQLPCSKTSTRDEKIYYNEAGGYFTKDKPINFVCPPGGILADEMGLGKTVEILSLMLTHPRTDIIRQAWQEPIQLAEKSMRKVRKRVRIRSPSPTEFKITVQTNDIEGISTDSVQQLSYNDDVLRAPSDQDLPDDEDTIMQVDGNQDDIDSNSPTSDEEYVPEQTNARNPSGSQKTGTRIQRKKVFYDESSSDPEEGCWQPPVKKSPVKKANGKNINSKLLVQKAKDKKEANGASSSKKAKPEVTKKFDPNSVLEGRNVTVKSKLGDMILFSIIQISDSSKENEASIQAIKKYLGDHFEKKLVEKTNKNINLEISNLSKRGLIYNTSGKQGASGSFSINPQFEEFDSRSLYQNVTAMNNPMDKIMENVITKVCYKNVPYVPQANQPQLKKKVKKESLYDKLKADYDRKLEACSDAFVLSDTYKKWPNAGMGHFLTLQLHLKTTLNVFVVQMIMVYNQIQNTEYNVSNVTNGNTPNVLVMM